MKSRLLLLAPFTLITLMLFFVLLDFGEGFPWFFAICSITGIYGIVHLIANHQQFKLVTSTLVLESYFKHARTIDLGTLVAWRELAFNIRGQRRITIILQFDNSEKVVVDNSEYQVEFDELRAFLVENHSKQKREF